MRKYIRSRLYDTDTAREVAHREHGIPTDGCYTCRTLFCKRSGEYFFLNEGGGLSIYGESDGDSSWYGEHIQPVSQGEARAWMEEEFDADVVDEEFSQPGDDRNPVNVRVSGKAKQALVDECARTGESQAAVIERLLLTLNA